MLFIFAFISVNLKELCMFKTNDPVRKHKNQDKCWNVHHCNLFTKFLFVLVLFGRRVLIRSVEISKNE